MNYLCTFEIQDAAILLCRYYFVVIDVQPCSGPASQDGGDRAIDELTSLLEVNRYFEDFAPKC